MKRSLAATLAVLAVSALAAGPAVAGEARRAMDEGFVLFTAGSYAAAAGKFEEAATKAGSEGLEPEAARYNAAISLLNVGKSPEAVTAFTQALHSSDPGLRERAHYNRGVALVAVAEALERRGDTKGAVVSLGQALEAYESAMLIDSQDEDPKVNHELAARKKAQLEEKLKGRPDREQSPQPETTQGEEQKPRKEMTNDEARLMLEAMKQQEISQRHQVQPFRGAPARVEKDW